LLLRVARMRSGRMPWMNARRLCMDGLRGGSSRAAVVASGELAAHLGHGRRVGVPGGFPETPLDAGGDRVEGSINARSRLDILDLDVRAPEGRGECVEH